MFNTTLIGVMLMLMNGLGMDSVSVEQLERNLLEEQEEQEIQEARNNGYEILQPIEIYFMYGNDNGTYWLEPSAEHENVIFVDYQSLKEWNIDYNELEHGNRMIGLFDETYQWELLEIITEEELIKESEESNKL